MNRLFRAVVVAALVVLGVKVAVLRHGQRLRDAIAGVG